MMRSYQAGCHGCGSVLGCALNCLNAPWNWDKPDCSAFIYMLRFRRWLGKEARGAGPLVRSHITWTSPLPAGVQHPFFGKTGTR